MTKSQKRNARRKRAKLRGVGVVGHQLTITINCSVVHPETIKCPDWNPAAIACASRASPSLMARARCVICRDRVAKYSPTYSGRFWKRTWATTSHEGFSAQTGEMKEVMTYVLTEHFARCPEGSAKIAFEDLGPEGQQEGGQEWLGAEEMETVVADVIAAVESLL